MKEEIDYVKRLDVKINVFFREQCKDSIRIANDTEIFQNHISNTLSQLKEHGLI